MSLISDGTIFIVDSSQRITGTSSNFQIVLNLPKGNDYDRVVVLQAIIPKSYYLCSAPSNTFILSENSVLVTITVPAGNYNVKSWCTIICALMNTSSPHSYTYSMTFPNSITSTDTGLFTMNVTGNGSIQPQIIFPTNSLLYEQFGFNVTSTNSFLSSTLISLNVVKFQVEDVLFIHSDLSYNNDQSTKNDVLQEIYASSTPPWSNIIYQNSGCIEAYSKRLLSSSKNVYNFSLSDEHNNPKSLNGLDWVHTVYVYKKDNINQLIGANLLRSINQ